MILGCQIMLYKVCMPLNLNLYLVCGVKFIMNGLITAVRLGAIVKIAMIINDF